MTLNKDDDIAFYQLIAEIGIKSIFYSFIIAGNLGIVLNILNIRTYSRRAFSHKTVGFYNIIMSTFHILSIVTSYLFFFPYSIGKPDLMLASDWACVSILFATSVCTQMSSWINVMVSFDRIVFVLYPHSDFFKIFKNKKQLLWIVAGILMVISICNIPNLFFSVEQGLVSNQNITSRKCTSSASIVFMRDLSSVILRTALPVILEFILNTILIQKLNTYKKNFTYNSNHDLKSEYKFSFTIVFVNILFLLTQLPSFIVVIYLNTLDYSGAKVNASRTLAIAQLVFVLTVMLSSFDYLSLFFVNFILSSNFRKEFKRTYIENH